MNENRIGQIRAEAIRKGSGIVSRARTAKAAGALLNAAGGFILARAVGPQGMAPFGVAFSAAKGSGMEGLMATLGAMAGYFTLSGEVEVLKYIAALVLVYTAGVLFRGASEGKIRKALVDLNLLDAVVGLPANLFYGTGIPACILVFKKEGVYLYE